MPVSKIRRGAASGKVGYPNANDVRVDPSTDTLRFGTGTSGTTEKQVVDTSSTQTLTGKTQTSPTINTAVQAITAALLAATGADQAGAALIASGSFALIHATGADGTKGIRLPSAAAGLIYFIKNQDSANAVLKVYPFLGDAINAIAGDSPISMAAKTAAVFVAIDATTWFTFSLLPS